MRRRALVLGLLLATTLTGCAAATDAAPSAPASAAPSAVPSVAPERVPGSTVSTDLVTAPVPEGESLAVVIAADAAEQEHLALTAVQEFAAQHGDTVQVFADAATAASVDAALAGDADVIVGIGPAVTGAVDLASASNLDVRFLLLGSQLAEPTGNVIAVVWPGAEERAVFAEEDRSFADAATYAGLAIETGLAAFASGLDGHVVRLG